MSGRGRPSIEAKIGEGRFRALLRTMDIPSIARLICDHKMEEEEKSKCEACRRAIYRAKERLEAAERQDRTFEPIDEFDAIPEIKAFMEYCKAKKIIHFEKLKNRLFRMWQWIRESDDEEIKQTQRPILWNVKHIGYILPKVDEMKIGRYGYIYALRAFFESARRHDMLTETLLVARRKDLRSPKGAKRIKDRFTPQEYSEKIRPLLNDNERFMVDMHITLKCREGDREHGSLLDLKWSDINWEDSFYGFPMVTARVFEPKTGGGTFWEHCPIDLWFADLSSKLKDRHQRTNEDYLFPYDYLDYLKVWKKISDRIGVKLEPHDCRRSPSGWLRDLGLSDLAIGQYDPRTGKGIGYAGVGWENSEIFFQRYGKMNPAAIYDKKKRLDTSTFNGFINKIVEQKEWR